MAKYQQFLAKIGSNRDRAALRGIFSMFLSDDDPPKLKDLTLASIVLSGTETTQITISGTSTTGLLITKAATCPIQIGTKANLSGSGVAIPSTDDWGAVRVFTDDVGANIADSVRAVQSRTLLTISQSAGTIRGLQGHFKVLTGVNFDTGVYTPVQGYIELAGTHTVSAAGILACFDASIEIGTALTATGYVAGFKAELTGAGTCAAGLDCGFLVTNAAGAAVWTYGLYVEGSAADTGVYVGACTTGINLGGAATFGIKVAATIPDLLQLTAGAAGTSCVFTNAAVCAVATSHALRIDIGGVAHYIPVFSDLSWGS